MIYATTVKEARAKAKALLKGRWLQGMLHDSETLHPQRDDSCRFCAMGAIYMVCGLFDTDVRSSDDAYEDAKALAHETMESVAPDGAGTPENRLALFNDRTGRKEREVLALFDEEPEPPELLGAA